MLFYKRNSIKDSMKLFSLFVNILFFIPDFSLAFASVVKNDIADDFSGGRNNVIEESPNVQEAQPTNFFINCQYFLKTSFENDNFGANGNDTGYTHGHLTRIIKRCDSGRDINISLDSRLFTKIIDKYKLPINETIFVQRFEEENKINIEYTDWRDFSKMYQTAGLIVGIRSRDKTRLAGLEQKLFHNILGHLTIEALEYICLTTGESSNSQRTPENTGIEPLISCVPVYDYRQEDKNEEFFGGNIAVGKSYSLNGLKKICEKQCIDYLRTEVGIEFISLKKGSNIYIFSELDKSMPKPLEALSILASMKVQQNKGIRGNYRESALGLRYRASQFQLHYVFKQRSLPEDWDQFIEYDDEDNMVFFGLEIPF